MLKPPFEVFLVLTDLPSSPEMRDGLIQDMRDYIVAIQTLGCSVNWDHGLDGAIDMDLETRTMSISEEFSKHICDLSNWTISGSFADVFPELRGLYRIVEQDTTRNSQDNVKDFLRRRGIVSPESEIVAGG